MPNSVSRTEIADGIGFTSVIDSKFKTVTIRVKFVTELKKEKVSANALALSVIASSNSEYKTMTELSARTDELYGASLFSNVSKSGDVQVLEIGASVINNKYTFDNEDITGGILDLLDCCIFRPDVSDNSFNEKEFKYRKKDLLDTIDSEINNKRIYILQKSAGVIFENEPASCSSYGTRETAENLTAAEVYQAYCELLETAGIEIYYVASEEIPQIKESFEKSFKALKRRYMPFTVGSPSPLKSGCVRKVEKIDVNQMKMVMAYKTDCSNKSAMKLMNMMLGGSPTSKLFTNVREKMSLCYYCSSTIFLTKQTLMIDCGIEKENLEKTERAVDEQLEQIKNGEFTDDEIRYSVLAMTDALRGIGDTPSSYINWYFSRMLLNESESVDKEIENIKSVTRQQIIDCAKSCKPDTVYIVTGSEED